MKQIKLNTCPICGAHSFVTKFESIDFSVSKEAFKVDECQSCSLLFTNPRPPDSELGRYYQSTSYISHTNQSSGLFGMTYQVLRNWSIKRKMALLAQHTETGLLLDYGCGTGEFLLACKHNGWQVIGAELNKEVRKTASNQHNLEVVSPNRLEELADGSYDAVTMWHVLEHVADLKELSAALVRKIKQGGVLVIAIPNPDSWDALYYKEYWAAWDLPIHLYHLKKKNVDQLFSNLGMELVSTRRMPLDAFYISLLSEEYKAGRKKWIKAAIIGLLSNLKSFRKNNTSSLTYVFKKVKA